MRFSVIFPLACSIVGFVLAMLALFAGQKPGYMEDYAIVRLNMSMLGHDLIPTPTSPSQPSSTSGGFGSFVSGVVKNITDKIGDKIDDLQDDLADKLAAELGIEQWYSLHLMDACQGSFAPNATAPGAWFNVSNCTAPTPGYRINLTEIIDAELKVGPLNLDLARLNWPSGIQKQIERINSLLLAVFVFYVLGIGFSGLAIVLCAVAFFVALRRVITLSNFAVASLAALTLLIGSIITTIAAREGASTISDFGELIGVSATAGEKFIVLSWVAFAVMAAATLYWVGEFILDRRARKRVFTEKPAKGGY